MLRHRMYPDIIISNIHQDHLRLHNKHCISIKTPSLYHYMHTSMVTLCKNHYGEQSDIAYCRTFICTKSDSMYHQLKRC